MNKMDKLNGLVKIGLLKYLQRRDIISMSKCCHIMCKTIKPYTISLCRYNQQNYLLLSEELRNNVSKFIIDYSQTNFIPLTVKDLLMEGILPPPFKKGMIPEGITKLNLGNFYNWYIEKDILPSSLKIIIFSFYFNRKISNIFHEGLTHISFGWSFNKPIKKEFYQKVLLIYILIMILTKI